MKKTTMTKRGFVSLTRRCLLVIGPALLLFLLIHPYSVKQHRHQAGGNPSWYYTFQEVKDLYKVHYNRKERLEKYIYLKDGKLIGRVSDPKGNEAEFEVPNSFIYFILSHLQEGLEKGWFNYIFWLDLNHGHLFLPTEVKYSYAKLWTESTSEAAINYLLKVLSDKRLGVLYHSAEHFDPRDPATERYKQTRNIIGWFDGKRPIELTYPDPNDSKKRYEANTAGIPKGCKNAWWIGISASKNGTFYINYNKGRCDGDLIRLDISFEVRDIHDSITYDHKTRERGRCIRGDPIY